VDWHQHIVMDETVLAGKPVVKGTRLSVELMLGFLAQGWTERELLDNYPQLTRDQILACLSYAEERLRSERVYVVAG